MCEFFYLHIGATEKEHKVHSCRPPPRPVARWRTSKQLEKGFTTYLDLLAENWAEIHRALRPSDQPTVAGVRPNTPAPRRTGCKVQARSAPPRPTSHDRGARNRHASCPGPYTASAEGRTPEPDRMWRTLFEKVSALSQREFEVFCLLAEGASRPPLAISTFLNASPNGR
ncbi:hypothetical protein ACRAWF_07410 [Streptomyces sp. L7]